MRILIAEDEPITRRVLETALIKQGYEVVVTGDGNEALALLLSPDTPPLAILDVMMPGMQGVEVCRKVRESEQPYPTYIILLTANNRKDDVVAGLQAGANDYLTKPFNREELYARVQVGMRVVELQKALADRVSQLERAEDELRHLSLTDDLTGLYNRRGFLAFAERHLKTSRRTGEESLLLYADMDGLKQINDTLGHEAGSSAIVKMAEILQETFRAADIIARVGGDEFIVLANHVTVDDARSISSRLQKNLCVHNASGLSDYDLSLSLGVVLFRTHATTNIEDLIARADLLMYQNKREKAKTAVVKDCSVVGHRTLPKRHDTRDPFMAAKADRQLAC